MRAPLDWGLKFQKIYKYPLHFWYYSEWNSVFYRSVWVWKIFFMQLIMTDRRCMHACFYFSLLNNILLWCMCISVLTSSSYWFDTIVKRCRTFSRSEPHVCHKSFNLSNQSCRLSPHMRNPIIPILPTEFVRSNKSFTTFSNPAIVHINNRGCYFSFNFFQLSYQVIIKLMLSFLKIDLSTTLVGSIWLFNRFYFSVQMNRFQISDRFYLSGFLVGRSIW